MALGRLLLRFLLVPLGGCIAVVVAMIFVMVAHWTRLAQVTNDDYTGLTTFFVVAPMMAIGAALMLWPAILGALIAEAFALRSWVYHVLNGGLSVIVSLMSIGGFDKTYDLSEDPLIGVAAGFAAGLTYWLIAGWSAGFWKPVFAPVPPPVLPATARPVLAPTTMPPAKPTNEIAGASPAIRDSSVRPNN